MRGASLLVAAVLAATGCEDAFMIEVHAGGTDMAGVELYLGMAPCDPGVCDDVVIPGIPSPNGLVSYLHDGPEPFGADGTEPIYLELRATDLGDYIPVAIAVGFDANKQIVGSALLHDLQLTDSAIYRIELTPLDTPGSRLWFARQPLAPKTACVAREKSADKIEMIVPAGDPDCDGVDVSSDLCPALFDPDQRDFDGDKRADGCDPCPHLAVSGTRPVDPDRDGDGDGVGDGCDPEPMIAGDRRVLWSGFYEPSDISDWTMTAGTWSVSGAGASQTSLAPYSALRAGVNLAAAVIQTRYQIVGLDPAGAEIGVCAGLQDATGQNVCCDVLKTQFQETALETWWNDNTGLRGRTSTPWPGEFDVDVIIALDYYLYPHSTRCVGRTEGDTTSHATGFQNSMLDSSGDINLYMKRATARYDYVFVVEPLLP